MRRKTKEKGLNPKNELFQELEESEWIKNPLVYSQIRGDFNLTQTNMMITILSALQGDIQTYLARQKSGEAMPNSLFPDDVPEGEHKFVINLADLDEIPAKAYDELEEACRKLLKMSMSYPVTDEHGNQFIMMRNIFSAIKVPRETANSDSTQYKFKSGQRRRGTIEVFMLKSCLNEVFDMRRGYSEHLRHIVSRVKRKRTPRLYIYLSKWKEVGHKLVDYNELKEFLGVMQYDAKHIRVLTDQYAKYARFCKDVLDPIQAEMDELGAHNEVDFTFTYEPRYLGAKKIGNPDQMKFTIKPTKLGKAMRHQSDARRDTDKIRETLLTEYHLTEQEANRLYASLEEEMLAPFQAKVVELRKSLKDYAPASVPAYVYTALRRYIEEIRPVAEPLPQPAERAKEVVKRTKKPTAKQTRQWQAFVEAMRTALTTADFDTWIAPITLQRVDGRTLTLQVPSQFFYEYIEEHFLDQLAPRLRTAFGNEVQVQYTVAS